MSEFKYFRHKTTGKVGSYPADFGDLFYDVFEEVDSNAVDCVDCGPTKEEYQNALGNEFDYEDDYEFAPDSLNDDGFPDPVVTPSKPKDK